MRETFNQTLERRSDHRHWNIEAIPTPWH